MDTNFELLVRLTSSALTQEEKLELLDKFRHDIYENAFTDGQNDVSETGKYNNGYNDGYDCGHQEGYDEGYKDGYERGDDDGYERGVANNTLE